MVFLLMCSATVQKVLSQVEGKLRIHGSIKEEKSKLAGAEVLVYVGNKLVDKVPVDDGSFEVILDFENDYTVVFAKNGYASKKLKFDTRNVPSDRGAFGFEFKCGVGLFKKIPGFDMSVLNEPIGFVKYNEDKKEFTHDATYTAEIQQRLAEMINELENAKAELEDNYITSIEDGDRALKDGDYFNARIQYEAALKLKPEEKYPTNQLTKLDKLESDSEATQKKYDDLITKADGLLGSESYDDARLTYQEASTVKPKEKYPKEKISEIDKKLKELKEQQAALAKAEADVRAQEEKFKQLVTDADNAFKDKNYDLAKKGYEAALEIKADAPRPTNQLKAIGVLEEEARAESALAEKYQEAIDRADKAFRAKDWETARVAYKDALAVKESETYPADQLKAIDSALADAEKAAADAEYQAIIDKADKAFKAQEWEAAQSEYNNALAKRPGESYPTAQLATIDDAIANAEKAAADAEYQAIIDKADKAFKAQEWEAAKGEYNNALAKRPGESYPTAQLAAIDEAIANAAKEKADEFYNNLIADADKAFKERDWETARNGYRDALAMRSNAEHPTLQLKEIDRIIASDALAEKDAQYQKFIDDGDKAFKDESFDAAKAAYREALGVKPDETYPNEQIAAIDKIIVDRKSAEAAAEAEERQYQDLITTADAAFDSQDYETAQDGYRKALGVREEEKYPQKRLDEIEGLLAEMAADKAAKAEAEAEAKRIQEQYDAQIAKADGEFDKDQLQVARASYQEALKMKENAGYPLERIRKIDEMIAEKASAEEAAKLAAEKEAKYQKFIQLADAAFDNEDWKEARKQYTAARDAKPDEDYPQERITAIANLLDEQEKAAAEAAELAKKQEQYQSLIADADKAFEKKEYAQSKGLYQQAQGVMSEEPYPGTRIAEIDGLLAEMADKEAAAKAAKEKEQEYQRLIAQADKDFGAKEYVQAKSGYEAALKVKTDAPYPPRKIKEIEGILADIAAKEKANQAAKDAELQKEQEYKDLISKADGLLASNEFEQAKASYQMAIDIKPKEAYPREKISEIAKRKAAMAREAEEKRIAAEREKARQEKYDRLIAAADGSFDNKQYGAAKRDYLEAKKVKPEEDYPQKRLDEIGELIAAMGTTKPKETDSETKEEKFVDELAQKYPEGVTEEITKEATKTIITRIVVRDGKGDEYKKVVHNWGGKFFFKNGESISEFVFNTETVK